MTTIESLIEAPPPVETLRRNCRPADPALCHDVKQYVLCYAHPLPHTWWPEVLLIEKRKPAWQAGKYNLPGGSIEEGETCHEAARRELWEEANIDCKIEDIKLMGTIEGDKFVVYVMFCGYDSLRGKNVAESITSEPVFWLPIEDAFRDPNLIDNLRIIIPLVRSGLMGWSLKHAASNYVLNTDSETVKFGLGGANAAS